MSWALRPLALSVVRHLSREVRGRLSSPVCRSSVWLQGSWGLNEYSCTSFRCCSEAEKDQHRRLEWKPRARMLHSSVNSGSGALHTSKTADFKISPTTKVELLGAEGEELGVMSKSRAEKLAKEEGLKMVMIDIEGSPFPKYRLMTGKQLIEEQKKQKLEKQSNKTKATKSLNISSKISEHDLEVKVNHVLQWLGKGHEVKVTILEGQQQNSKMLADVFKRVMKLLKDSAQVSQSQGRQHELRFLLKPTKEEPTVNTGKLKPLTTDQLKQQ